MRQSLQSQVDYLTAGASLAATVISDTYAPTAYSLQYRFRRGETVILEDANGDTSAGSWAVAVAGSATAELTPGIMTYVAYATDTAGTIYEAEAGGIPIRGNPARVSRSQSILDAVVAVIEGRADEGQATTALGDVQLQHMTPDELTRWETFYRGRILAEERRLRKSHGMAGGQRLLVEFQ